MKGIKHLLRCGLLGALVALNGCGFALRGDYQLPDGINKVVLTSTQNHSLLKRALKERLQINHINVADKSSETDASGDVLYLHVMPDQLDRRLLSVFSTGQVAEYELSYHVSYYTQLPGEKAREAEFVVMREYQDDPDAVLAKSKELELILTEMRQLAVNRILRQLASPHTNPDNKK